jgi:hypothetical protein
LVPEVNLLCCLICEADRLVNTLSNTTHAGGLETATSLTYAKGNLAFANVASATPCTRR